MTKTAVLNRPRKASDARADVRGGQPPIIGSNTSPEPPGGHGGASMSKTASKPVAVKLPAPDDPSLKGEFKSVGGSKCDVFNVILLNQVANTLWVGHSDKETQTKQGSFSSFRIRRADRRQN